MPSVEPIFETGTTTIGTAQVHQWACPECRVIVPAPDLVEARAAYARHLSNGHRGGMREPETERVAA